MHPEESLQAGVWNHGIPVSLRFPHGFSGSLSPRYEFADCRHRGQIGLRLPESFLHGIQAEARGKPDGIQIKTWSYRLRRGVIART